MNTWVWGRMSSDALASVLAYRAEVQGVGANFKLAERIEFLEQNVRDMLREEGISAAGEYVISEWRKDLKNLGLEGGNISVEERLSNIDRIVEILCLEYIES